MLRLGLGVGAAAFSVVREPAHGAVALAPGADGLLASATYTPAAGFSGEDSFTYVATDARGLTSPPATARVRRRRRRRPPRRSRPAAARLSRVRVVKRRGRCASSCG